MGRELAASRRYDKPALRGGAKVGEKFLLIYRRYPDSRAVFPVKTE
jgi:hypothetical protein